MILQIDLHANVAGPTGFTDADSVTRGLIARGYDELDLVGLSSFRATLRDGKSCDTMPLRTEDDATFLMESYNHLSRAMSEVPPTFHRTYLWDGSFEITGLILEDRVRVRIGEYRAPFEPESDEGVTLSRSEYRAVWASIAAALLTGSQGKMR